jgi:ABC-type polysaccharide/polyol phosphate export permease
LIEDYQEPPERVMIVTSKGRYFSPIPVTTRLQRLWNSILQLRVLVAHNIYEKNVGTVLGALWLMIEPALYAAVMYMLVVLVMGIQDIGFKYLLASVTFWRLHASMLDNGPFLLRRADVFKNTTLSVFLVIYEMVLTRLFYFILSTVLLFIIVLWDGQGASWNWLLLLPVVLIQFIFSLGLMHLIAAAGAFVKDIAPFVNFGVSMWWFLSPGIYGMSRVPDRLQVYFQINPFAHILPAYHKIIILHEAPDWGPLLLILAGGILILFLGKWAVISVRYYIYKYI